MEKGIVKWFDEEKNFGLITDSEGKALHVRGSNVLYSSDRIPLIQGEEVEFERGTDNKGQESAIEVKITNELKPDNIGFIEHIDQENKRGRIRSGSGHGWLFLMAKRYRSFIVGQEVEFVGVKHDDGKIQACNLNEVKHVGVIVHIDQEKKFGLISSGQEKTCRFQISELSKSLRVYQCVEYVEVKNADGKIQACNINNAVNVKPDSIGVIVHINQEEKYGLISSGQEKTCFFQISELSQSLHKGQYVEYVGVTYEDGKIQACNLNHVTPMVGKVSAYTGSRGTIKPECDVNLFQVSRKDIVIFKKEGFRGLEAGNSVSFIISPSDKKSAFCVTKIEPLKRFAVINNEDELFKDLAENKVLKGENWEYKQQRSSLKYPILRNYLFSTFRRLEEEDKTIQEESQRKVRIDRPIEKRAIAIFDTGLVNNMYMVLYAVFLENLPHDVGKPYWHLIGFQAAGEKVQSYNYTKHFGDPLPSRAEYFKEPAGLLYNSKLRLEPVTKHILEEREYRLPATIMNKIPKNMSSDDTLSCLNSLLKTAIEIAKQRILWNYKTAVPQWSFKNNNIQLLLPLCIEDPRRVDCALAVQQEEKAYIGYTILPLDWAYSNARLIARPHSDWLDPHNITEITDESDST